VAVPDLELLRAAGRIAAAARDAGARLIQPGARLRDVCIAVEDEVFRQGGALAFPTQTSRNAVAAHYCPSPEDDTVYAAGDLVKLDVGVHLDGWVVDTALTVSLGPGGDNLRDAARAALEAAIEVAGPGVLVRTVSTAIAGAMRQRGVRPIQNLCGHGVGRFVVHCPPAVLNVPEPGAVKLEAGMVVAIEPFATTGRGTAVERGTAEVFRLAPEREVRATVDGEVLAAMRAFKGLPFARRQLATLPRNVVEETIVRLRRAGDLFAYPPLVEESGHPVAQAEHTVYVGATGLEVLTR
jgi:methionyl aminopeptidase